MNVLEQYLSDEYFERVNRVVDLAGAGWTDLIFVHLPDKVFHTVTSHSPMSYVGNFLRRCKKTAVHTGDKYYLANFPQTTAKKDWVVFSRDRLFDNNKHLESIGYTAIGKSSVVLCNTSPLYSYFYKVSTPHSKLVRWMSSSQPFADHTVINRVKNLLVTASSSKVSRVNSARLCADYESLRKDFIQAPDCSFTIQRYTSKDMPDFPTEGNNLKGYLINLNRKELGLLK